MIVANETGHCGFLLFFSPAFCAESQYDSFYLMMSLFYLTGLLSALLFCISLPPPSKVKKTTLFHSGSFVSFPEEVLQHLEHDVQQLVTIGALSVFFSPLFILYNFSS